MSLYVFTLSGYVPGVRFDGHAWTAAKIEQAETETGTYTVLETQTFSETDFDPTNPKARNFTTTKATLPACWLRITFVDAEGNLQQAEPTFCAAQGSASLCSVGDVRAILQRKDSDTTQNPMIERWIPSASRAIMRRTEREFAPAQAGLTRTFEFPWEGQYVSLAPYDLRKATEVKVDTDAAAGGFALSTQEYRLFPRPSLDGTFYSIRVQPLAVQLDRLTWEHRQLQITGDWGMESIPSDVSQAAALTVAHWVRINVAAFRGGQEEPSPEPPKRGIPPEAWDLLRDYSRRPDA